MPDKKKRPPAQIAGGPRQKLIQVLRASQTPESQTQALASEALGPQRTSPTQARFRKVKKKVKRASKKGREAIIKALKIHGAALRKGYSMGKKIRGS